MFIMWIAAAWIFCLITLIWQFHRNKLKIAHAFLTMGIAAITGVILSKLTYVLLLMDSTIAVYGLEALIITDADTFSVFGLMAGGMLGAWLSAKLIKAAPSTVADLFAPCAAIFLAILRIGEKELGTIGVGSFVDSESILARFPFSVVNSYGEHLYAVFYLEALFALLCGVIALLCFRKRPVGVKAELCCFFLALPQIFCESLRARCMKWGFVRIEQVLCALLVLVLLGVAARRASAIGFKRYLPLCAGLFCIALIGLLEFALYKSSIPVWLCYTGMLTLLLGIAVIEVRVIKTSTVKQGNPLSA